MPSVVCNIYDPVTHELVFSKDDFTYLTLDVFDTGTAAGSRPLAIPAGAEVCIQQSTPAGKTAPGAVTVGSNDVSWTAGANSKVRVMIR